MFITHRGNQELVLAELFNPPPYPTSFDEETVQISLLTETVNYSSGVERLSNQAPAFLIPHSPLPDFSSQDCYFGPGNLSVLEMSHIDLESGGHLRSVTGSDTSVEDSVCFSDADEGSCYSQFFSTNGGSYDEYRFAFVSEPESGIVLDTRRASSATESSVEVEIESGIPEIKVHLAKVERDCRICHLGLESNSRESGVPIELGCSCKDDLAAAHKHCAETWFKIKGNKTCEICHSIARNVVGALEIEVVEQSTETGNASSTTTAPAPPTAETQSFWRGHRFLNFLLACMVFAFVISWLFHFNVSS